MARILEPIKTFCFWGLLFLLLLTIGFGVSINDLWTEAISGSIHIKIISIFLMISPVLFVSLEVLEFARDIKDGLLFLDSIGTSLLPLFWPIYMLFRRKDFDSLAYVIVMTVL